MDKLFSETFSRYNLLQHPFYLAWSEGTLSLELLAVYANEYGSFIKLISKGWDRIGEREIAEEEVGHFELWQNFTKSLHMSPVSKNLPSVQYLVEGTENNYKEYPSTLGALYAFEAQQPATATSKLEGLKKHYVRWNPDQTYFKVHENDILEPAMLEEKINKLNETEKSAAFIACAFTCKALWDALSGIMEAETIYS